MFAVSDASDVCHPAADAAADAAAAAAARPHDKADRVGMAWHPTTTPCPKKSTFYFLNNSVKN